MLFHCPSHSMAPSHGNKARIFTLPEVDSSTLTVCLPATTKNPLAEQSFCHAMQMLPGVGLPSRMEESWISRMADASTMFLTMKRLMALSLATSTPDASQRTRLTCTPSDRET